LNMAELAVRVAEVAPQERPLLLAVVGLLLVVFCAKAALLPLYLWLPGTYGRAPASVAALFVIMTKVGLYAVLRVYSLWFGELAGELEGYAWRWLLPAGNDTLLLAALVALSDIRPLLLEYHLVHDSAGSHILA